MNTWKRQEKPTELKRESKTNDLLSEFQAIKAQSTTRIVNLKMTLSCGCGDAVYDVRREVPYDSPLKDGDKILDRDLVHGDQYRDSSYSGRFNTY